MSRPFSPKRRPAILATSVAVLFSLGFLLGSPRAVADEYWDGTNTGGSGTPNGAGGSGTWDNVTTNWVDATGNNPQVYNPNDTAHFATVGGSVTLGDNITITNLSFDVDGYTIDSPGGFAITASSPSTITVAAGATATINANIIGGGSLNLPGSGTINLAGSGSSFSGGVTLGGGRLNINSSSALGSGTLTITGGTLGTTVDGGIGFNNPVSVQGSFSVATNVDTSNPGNQNLIFGNTVDLGASGATITGVTPGGQVQFQGAVSGSNGVTFTTSAAVDTDPNSQYVAFIYASQTGNTYTGTTSVSGHAILAMQTGAQLIPGDPSSTMPQIAIHGDVTVDGNGVLEYIGADAGFNDQIADTAVVTINSPGLTILGGLHFDGLELRNATDTIGSLMGNANGIVGLGGGILTVANGGNFAGVIEDGDFGSFGSLTIKGGTLNLSGANTYTGLTTINTGGTLQAGATNTFSKDSSVIIELGGVLDLNNFDQTVGEINDSLNPLDGGGTIHLGSATLTTGNNNIEGTFFSGVIDGTGGLTKIGTGTLEIAGNANDFTGQTTVNGGALILSGNSKSAVVVNSNAFFELFSPNLDTGAGTTPVTVNASGSFLNFDALTVTGAGSRGTRLAASDAFMNNLDVATISGETGVYVDNPTGVATLVNHGTITGTGGTSVNALNSAGVTIGDFGKFVGAVQLGTGANTVIVATQTAYTPISAGAGVNDTLRLAGAGDDTLKGADFTGYEFLNKVGGGMWTLTGSDAFSRGTVIEAGTLNVRGILTSTTMIHDAGTLAGTGTVAGNVFNFGLVNPGQPTDVITTTNLPGTLSIKGDYHQGSTGVLLIQVNGANNGQFSRLAVSGRAQLDGTLILQGDSSAVKLKMGQKVTFLTASNGVNGTFSNVDNPFATGTIVVGRLVYDANSVSLVGGQGSFMSIDHDFHLTYNQKAVAKMLDSAAADKRAAKLMTFLDDRPLKKLPGDFDQIAPEEMASVFRLGVSLSDVQARNVQRRTADLRAGVSGFSAAGFETTGSPNYSGGVAGPSGADGKDGKTAGEADRRWGTFITGVGDFAHVGDSGNARGYDLNTGGVTVGADYKLTPKVAVGVTAGYAGTNANLTDDGRLLVNSGRVGAYGTYYTGGYYADAAVTGGVTNYSTRRSSLEGVASGSTQGSSVDVLVDTGYDWRIDALTIGPTASFQYTYVGIEGYTEHGSLTPLRYAGQHQSSIRSTFGLRAAYDWKVGSVLVRPEVSLAWQHEYGDRSFTIDSALASGAGDAFAVADTPIGRDSLLFGAGVAVLWNPRTSTYLYYDADLLKKEYNSQSVSGGLRLNF